MAVLRSSWKVSNEVVWCLSPMAVLIRVRAIASDVARSCGAWCSRWRRCQGLEAVGGVENYRAQDVAVGFGERAELFAHCADVATGPGNEGFQQALVQEMSLIVERAGGSVQVLFESA